MSYDYSENILVQEAAGNLLRQKQTHRIPQKKQPITQTQKKGNEKMIFEFINLSQEETEQIFAFEMENPDCVAREVSASFDGYTAIQLLTPENIESASEVLIAAMGMIAAISAAKSSAKATIKASEINAAAMVEAAKINASTVQKAEKSEPENPSAPDSPQNTKEIYVQLSNGERRLIPTGASVEQIKEIVGYREET